VLTAPCLLSTAYCLLITGGLTATHFELKLNCEIKKAIPWSGFNRRTKQIVQGVGVRCGVHAVSRRKPEASHEAPK